MTPRTRTRTVIVAAAMLTILSLAACRALPPLPDFGRSARAPLASHCVSIVNALNELRAPYQQTPDYLRAHNPQKRGGEFDANSYFTVLKHLSLPEGKALDWVQYFGGIGAEPILYVRDANAAPFTTYDEYRAAGGTGNIQNPTGEAVAQIRTDDTPEGYLELTILGLTGVDFYRWWHAGYRDYQVICSRNQLDRVARQIKGDWPDIQFPAYQPRVSDGEVAPRVTLGDEKAQVTLAYFTKWGGLLRQTTALSRGLPHTLEVEPAEMLEPWRFPVTF